ncbi:MAG: hypothetical protein Q7S70_01450, partial [bacterium]|nr:hypothetical protein [bacterium]
GKAYSIKWLFQDLDKIDTVVLTNYSSNINYSLGNNIGASSNSNSFDWAISSNSSIIPVGDSYRIKLESCVSGTCYSDQSDNYFSIVNSSTTSSLIFEKNIADISSALSQLQGALKKLLGR